MNLLYPTFLLIFLFQFSAGAIEVETDRSISEDQAVEIIELLEASYKNSPISSNLLQTLRPDFFIYLLYEEDSVFGNTDAWATTMENGTIFISGKILKSFLAGPEVFAAFVCHEIGHLMGGAPLYREGTLSVEGQADYYAASSCLKRFFLENPNYLSLSMAIDQTYTHRCQEFYRHPQAVRICTKSMQAGLNFAIIAALEIQDPILPAANADESYQQRRTIEGRDTAQCVADNYEAGALCDMDPYALMSAQSPADSACPNRPKCWYAYPSAPSLAPSLAGPLN